MKFLTESDSAYRDLEKMPVRTLLESINREDRLVPLAVSRAIPDIERLVKVIVPRMKKGGRLFYIGAGTSGRLGIVDASECPPTYGIAQGRVIGVIAGGDTAIRQAVEGAEDDADQAWKDLSRYKAGPGDVVIGIAASGTTPYVVGGLKACHARKIKTGCITCNPGSPVTTVCDYPVVAAVGPEFVTGSTRMKAGTAQKLVLNMISTSVMIRLGHVKGNKMVDMMLTNAKLVKRGTRMVAEQLMISEKEAGLLLLREGSVRKAINQGKKKTKRA